METHLPASPNRNIAFAFAGEVCPDWFSIIIPTGNDPEGVRTTLQSLEQQIARDACVEVLVANDGGHAAVTEVCRAFPGVREVLLPQNVGAYIARNTALRKSRGEFVGFLDANVEASPTWLQQAREEIRQTDYVAGAIAFPTVESPGVMELLQIVREFPVGLDFATRGGYTANLVMRRSVFERLGGFEERLKSLGDFEFGCRVQATGMFRCVFCKDLIVTHPFRGWGEILRKQRRMAYGHLRLGSIFPERFPRFNRSLGVLLHAALPPRRLRLIESAFIHFSIWQWIACYLIAWLNRLVFTFWLVCADRRRQDYIDPPQQPKNRSSF